MLVLFLSKTGINLKNKIIGSFTGTGGALTYNGATIGGLVNKDTDGDSIPDWEERLWGTDPTKKETTPGISDSVAIEKLKAEKGIVENVPGSPENLTETDKFARDLFSTVAATNQGGQAMDQSAIDKISSSVVNNIKNSSQKKIYLLSDLKITSDSIETAKNYNTGMTYVAKIYKGTDDVLNVLKKFVAGGDNPDPAVLSGLDPVINNFNKTITEMLKIKVPQKLAQPHLDMINALEKVKENLSDMKLYDTDAIVTFSAVSQYSDNNTKLDSAISALMKANENELRIK